VPDVKPEILIPGDAIGGPAGNGFKGRSGVEQGIAAESRNDARGGGGEKVATAHELPYKLLAPPVNTLPIQNRLSVINLFDGRLD
jgi:hypothetical protein